MVLRTALRFLFILYCVEAGVFLLLAPWSPRWDESVLQLASLSMSTWLLHPAVRGAITGFGLIHLVWGAHDLDLWLGQRRAEVEARVRTELPRAPSSE